MSSDRNLNLNKFLSAFSEFSINSPNGELIEKQVTTFDFAHQGGT